MPRQTWVQNAFNAGELSPYLAGRTDVEKYGAGARTALNFTVRPQGGLTRRSGTRFVLECEDSTRKSRLVPFIFSSTQAYVLEFGHNVIRVFKDEGVIESAPSTPLEIVSTYTEAELPALQFAQSTDTLYIVHESHAPAKLTRSSHTSWTLSDISFNDGPWLPQNTGDITLDPSGTSGSVTVVASSALFAASDVGRMLRIQSGGATDSLKDRPWAWGLITAFTSSTQVTWAIDATSSSLSDQSATLRWRLGAFSATAAVGYPRCVSFFEQRLVFAANAAGPQTIYASKSADFENFAPTTDYDSNSTGRAVIADDNGFTYQIASNQVNVIRWMNALGSLVIGTTSGVWTMRASSQFEAVTPTNVQVRRSSVTGGAAIQSVNVDDEIVFISDTSRKLFVVGYEFQSDAYKPRDLTLFAEHIGQSGITAIDYAHEPNTTVWCVRTDGTLVGLTYLRDQAVTGFSRHVLGGSFGSGGAVVESVAVIPGPLADHDQVWLTVKRTINGVTKRYVEFFEEELGEDEAQEDAFFVDSGLTYDGAPATTISGLDHLEGQTVQVLADGAKRADAVVSSGDITLTTSASVVHAGLAYVSDMDTMRPETTDPEGSAQSKQRGAPSVTLRFHRTIGGKVGPDSAHLETIYFRDQTDPMDTPVPFFTGEKEVQIERFAGSEARIFVRQDLPLPMNLLYVSERVWMGDR